MSTVLRGMTWDHPRGLDSVRGCASAWGDVRPDVTVEWEARSLQGFADQPLEGMLADYDLLVIDHPHIPIAAVDGLLLPLDGAGHDEELAGKASSHVGQTHVSYESGGRQYGLAIDAAAQVSAYRPDLLDAPPTSWDEVLELARGGRVVWPAKPVDAVSTFLTLTAGSGRPVCSTSRFVEPESGLAALDLMHRLAALVPAECLDENPIQTAERLSGSDQWCYSPLLFGYTNYGRPGFRENRLAYVDIPRSARGVRGSCLGGAGIAVSARTSHPEEAIEYAFWLDSAAVQSGPYYWAGGQPGHVAAWDDQDLDADSLGFFSGTRATLDGSWTRPRFPHWLVVQDEVGTAVNRALKGEIDDEQCLRLAEESYERMVERDAAYTSPAAANTYTESSTGGEP